MKTLFHTLRFRRRVRLFLIVSLLCCVACKPSSKREFMACVSKTVLSFSIKLRAENTRKASRLVSPISHRHHRESEHISTWNLSDFPHKIWRFFSLWVVVARCWVWHIVSLQSRLVYELNLISRNVCHHHKGGEFRMSSQKIEWSCHMMGELQGIFAAWQDFNHQFLMLIDLFAG